MKKESSALFYLSAEKTYGNDQLQNAFIDYLTPVRTEVESLAVGVEDLINGVGGALGLFLGWSLLSVLSKASILLHPLLSRVKSPKNHQKTKLQILDGWTDN